METVLVVIASIAGGAVLIGWCIGVFMIAKFINEDLSRTIDDGKGW